MTLFKYIYICIYTFKVLQVTLQASYSCIARHRWIQIYTTQVFTKNEQLQQLDHYTIKQQGWSMHHQISEITGLNQSHWLKVQQNKSPAQGTTSVFYTFATPSALLELNTFLPTLMPVSSGQVLLSPIL